MIRLAIFDLEDTLCDHAGAHRRAQARVNVILREAGLPVEQFWALFQDIDPGLQASMVAGFMSQMEYLWHRFSDVCACLERSVGVLPDVIGQIYGEETIRRVKLFDDVPESLSALRSQGIQIAVLSNGDSVSQREKFRRLGLGDYIDSRLFFVSEELGVSKPEPLAFRMVLKECGVAVDEAVMVGDSVEEDVWSADSMGLRGILLDRNDLMGVGYAGERIADLRSLVALVSSASEQGIVPENAHPSQDAARSSSPILL